MVVAIMKCLCYTLETPTVLGKEQLFGCLGMLYYTGGGFKGIIINIFEFDHQFMFYELLTPNLEIEKRSTLYRFLEIREL